MTVLLRILLLTPLILGIEKANNRLPLNEGVDIINVGPFASYVEDISGSLTLEDIVRSEWQSRFRSTPNAAIDFPANNSVYWIRLNICQTSDQNLVLFIDEAKFIGVDLSYFGRDSIWTTILNGSSISLSERKFKSNFPVFELNLAKGESLIIYLRLRPMGIPVPIYIASTRYFQVYDAKFKLIFGVIIGIVLLISVYNFLLFFTTRDKLRLLYSLNAFVFAIYISTFNGYTIFISALESSNTFHIVLVLTFLSQFILLLYGYKFLNVSRVTNGMRHVATLFMGSIMICLVIALLANPEHFHQVVMVASVTGVMVILLCLTMGLVRLSSVPKVFKPVVLLYVFSYVSFLLFFALEMAHIYLGWKYLFFMRYLDTAFFCEVVGLFVALNSQGGIERKLLESEKNRMQAENNRLIEEKNLHLEEMVNQRTLEIQNKNKLAENLSQKLKVRSDELLNLNKLKDRLLSILAHDLRSPLHQLHGLLTLSADSKIAEPELKQVLGQIKTQMGGTLELTNSLLLWAKSQMSGFKVSKTSFNLYALVSEKVSFFRAWAGSKGVMLRNEIPDGSFVHSDIDIVSLNIHNVIANAIKFCINHDSVTVSCETSNGPSLICVEDTGIGMSEDQLKNIFKESNLSTRGTSNEKGSGLGLRICNDLIRQLGGKIWIESKVGRGTKVYLDFQMKITNSEFTS